MFIYKIENIQNGFVYIGQTKNTVKRFSRHKNALSRNVHRNQYLQNAWNKYGENAFKFSTIECLIIKDPVYLNKRELWWIENSCNLYNINKCINVNKVFYPFCPINNPSKGKPCSKEAKNKMSKSMKQWHKLNDNPFLGRNHTEDSRNKMSSSLKEYYKTNNAHNKNKPMSDKQKKHLSNLAKERYKNNAYHPACNPEIIKFQNIKTGKVVSMTRRDFKIFLNNTVGKGKSSSISSLISGRIKSHRGYKHIKN